MTMDIGQGTPLRGHVTFEAKVGGVHRICGDSFCVNGKECEVESVRVDPSDDSKISLTINFHEVTSQDEARETAYFLANKLFNRLAFRFGLQLTESEMIDDEFSPIHPRPGTIYLRPLVVRATVGDGITVKNILPLNQERLAALGNYLEQDSLSGEPQYGLFQSVIRSTNVTERYMQLYALLLAFAGGTQARVNEFIRQNDPNVEERAAKRRNDLKPVYTWLRNELAHFPRTDGMTLAAMRREMGIHVDGLQRLVQLAIEQSDES